MKAVLQRVSKAEITINGKEIRRSGKGLVVLLGIGTSDTEQDADWLIKKITLMRIFNDDKGKMNLSVSDINGSILLVSQFTLMASVKKGNRPSFDPAAEPDYAEKLYNYFLTELKKVPDIKTESGEFGADMKIALVNEGPVTIIIDSRNRV